MIEFILNNQLISTQTNPSLTLLDFVRYVQNLKGTKIGCREGDCGACTILIGELSASQMVYKSLTSCLTPLGNVQGKHVVTIEGLNMENLSPFQQAMVDESGSQCGFCTVGFIVSFAGECLKNNLSSYDSIISAIDGNICRCTGYKSIERAAQIVADKLAEKDLSSPLEWLIEHKFIPGYFKDIPSRLSKINTNIKTNGKHIIAGGTDLYVQKPDKILESDPTFFSDNKEYIGIQELDGQIIIGASTNTSQLMESPIMESIIPGNRNYFKLISSTPIRNIATIAGNLVNASPIGDLSIFFLALHSKIQLQNKLSDSRELDLKDFFLDYKKLNKKEEEFITQISFQKPADNSHFHFEKVSKRKYLDIASVNSAIQLKIINKIIIEAHVSAGGVAPVPKYLDQTSRFLENKELNESTVLNGLKLLQAEIAPISDVRGSADYKRLLLRQLFYAHFIELFPEIFKMKALA